MRRLSVQSVFIDCYIGYFYLIALGIVLGSITPYVGNEKTEDQEGGRTSQSHSWSVASGWTPCSPVRFSPKLQPPAPEANLCCPPRQGLSIVELISPTHVRVNK